METAESCSRQEQAGCEQLVRDYPRIGYALCYLYSVYRGQGVIREDALTMTLAHLNSPSHLSQ